MTKLSSITIDILKNFSSINSGLFIPAGGKVRIKNPTGSLLAEAVIAEQFPVDICISDLSRFLAIVGMEPDTDISVETNDIIISANAGRNVTTYRMGSPKHIAIPQELPLDTNSTPIAAFSILKSEFIKTKKAAGLLGLPNVGVFSTNGEPWIKVFDAANKSENVFKSKCGEETIPSINVFFKVDNLEFIPGDYAVKIWKGIAQFKLQFVQGVDLVYYVAAEIGSKYE